MTSDLGFYAKPNVRTLHTFEQDLLIFDNVEEDEDFENATYIQDVPYTSSSVDRSSIGSIPWADDAVKLNQVEWEKIEKIFSGLAPLPEDGDLRNEIKDWQKKFPQIVYTQTKYDIKHPTKHQDGRDSLTLDFEVRHSEVNKKLLKSRDRLNQLESIEDEFSIDESLPSKYSREEDTSGDINLCNMLQDITLNSVPLEISQRDSTKHAKRKCTSSSSSYSLRSPPSPVIIPFEHPAAQRLRMPPILNVIETTRRFRNLAEHKKNPSFVQLTQVQQTKSAVLTHNLKSTSHHLNDPRSAWNLPLRANRLFSNRNSVVLPALTPRQQIVHQYNTQPRAALTTSSELGTTNTTPSSSRGNPLSRKTFNTCMRRNNNMSEHRNFMAACISTGSTSHSNASTSGRSISAAIQYPRTSAFSALYLPYSASKFHSFK